MGGLRGAGGAPPGWAGSGLLGKHLPDGQTQGHWGSTFQVDRLRVAGGAPPRWVGSGALRVGEEGALKAEVPKHQAVTPPSLQEGSRYSQSHTAVHLGLEPVQGSFSLVEGDRQAHLLGCRPGGLKSLEWNRWTPLTRPSDSVSLHPYIQSTLCQFA